MAAHLHTNRFKAEAQIFEIVEMACSLHLLKIEEGLGLNLLYKRLPDDEGNWPTFAEAIIFRGC